MDVGSGDRKLSFQLDRREGRTPNHWVREDWGEDGESGHVANVQCPIYVRVEELNRQLERGGALGWPGWKGSTQVARNDAVTSREAAPELSPGYHRIQAGKLARTSRDLAAGSQQATRRWNWPCSKYRKCPVRPVLCRSVSGRLRPTGLPALRPGGKGESSEQRL